MNTPAYKDCFEKSASQFATELSDINPDWVKNLRLQAYTQFLKQGFPTQRQEAWRYTNISPIIQGRYEQVKPTPPSAEPKECFEKLVPNLSSELRLVFTNGFYSGKFSNVSTLPDGVVVTSLSEAILSMPERVKPHLGQAADQKNSFADLNTALAHEGAFIDISKKVSLAAPIHVIYLSSPSQGASIAYPRNLIIAGEQSSFSLIESYIGYGPYFTNGVTEIVLNDEASLKHWRLQQESKQAYHVSQNHVVLNRSSHYQNHNINLGGKIARTEIKATLQGEGADCELNGLYFAGLDQHTDNQTLIEHAKPHTRSRELYKGLIASNGRAVFNGKIIVAAGAQKTDASQTNKNLLLSEEAVVNTAPQLQIDAHDVKCSHGATVGQLDPDAIFYLRSRGIGEEEARLTLTQAFADEILESITNANLKRHLKTLVSEQLQWQKDSAHV